MNLPDVQYLTVGPDADELGAFRQAKQLLELQKWTEAREALLALATRSTSNVRYRALLALREYPHTFSVFPFGDVLHYTDKRKAMPPGPLGGEVTAFLAARGLTGVSSEQIPATIEDSFMSYMGSAEEAPVA